MQCKKEGNMGCALAGDDSLDASSLSQAAGLALQLAVKVLDGMFVPLDRLQMGHIVCQTPHLLPLSSKSCGAGTLALTPPWRLGWTSFQCGGTLSACWGSKGEAQMTQGSIRMLLGSAV